MAPSPSPSPSPGPHLAADPQGLILSASRLRGLVPVSPPQVDGMFLLDDATVPASAPDSGVARFLSALTAASRAQEGRVAALGRYAGGAAGALDWFAGEVGGAEDSSSARFGREGEVLA
ncbi:hypothetical protein ACFWGD_05130 [Corynebacterium sp. NPDC060344]|uniref:hypothetical protein n=1 Tax=Corynebacterium sp. NPDC060344 TaxID=3347101 RepID=UPI003658E892